MPKQNVYPESIPDLRDALTHLMKIARKLADRSGDRIPAEITNMYNAALAKSYGNAPPPLVVDEAEDEDEKQLVAPRTYLNPVTPSTALAAIVGPEPQPRTDITKKLWEYIKQHGLQDANNRRMINSDAKLKLIFQNKKQVSMFEMTKLVSNHLK